MEFVLTGGAGGCFLEQLPDDTEPAAVAAADAPRSTLAILLIPLPDDEAGVGTLDEFDLANCCCAVLESCAVVLE